MPCLGRDHVELGDARLLRRTMAKIAADGSHQCSFVLIDHVDQSGETIAPRREARVAVSGERLVLHARDAPELSLLRRGHGE